MLSEKFSGELVKSIISPMEALEEAKVSGAVLSMDASWHRKMEGKKELIEIASFAFLLSQEGRPLQVEIEFENDKFKTEKQDLSKEMGTLTEEEKFMKQMKLLTGAKILSKIEKSARVQTAMKKARHMRLASMSFVIFDDKYEAPVWHIVLKNWPLTNYFKREKPLTVELTVDAIKGSVLSFRQVI